MVEVLARTEPSLADWISWVLALLAIGVSTFVGIMAWRTSHKATLIANAALDAENARDHDRYRQAMTEAIANFILEVATYSSKVQKWLLEANEVEMSFPGTNPDELPYPTEPSAAAITGLFEVARLVARGEDRTVLAETEPYLVAVRKTPLHSQEAPLRELVSALRKWRDGTWSANEIVDFLRTKKPARSRA
ncbi:hypothetical protein [Diaminobutyricimonas sp. TR449]|uniref:hypothetical protein n=1 Tax=Diaminobutyricimonas sp. TR449 TaxID=2708076 RepID=UPI00141E45A5|nr:hypothetical protein [Diaminobutyricimonas sp. TR449]